MVPVAFWTVHFFIFVITGKMQEISTQVQQNQGQY